jgi:hypothetical protein
MIRFRVSWLTRHSYLGEATELHGDPPLARTLDSQAQHEVGTIRESKDMDNPPHCTKH